MTIATTVLLLAGCSALPTHNSEPKGCRERVAFHLATAYSDPADLATAINTICEENP